MGFIGSAKQKDRLVSPDEEELRDVRSEHTERAGTSIISIIQRISETSAIEIDKHISELETLRKHLQNEGARVEQRLAEYMSMTEATTRSISLITETLARNVSQRFRQ